MLPNNNKINILKNFMTEVPLLVPEAIWLNQNVDLELILKRCNNFELNTLSIALLDFLDNEFFKNIMTIEDELYLYSLKSNIKEYIDIGESLNRKMKEDYNEEDEDFNYE